MDQHSDGPYVKISTEKVIPKSDILCLLRTYNCYHEGRSFQLHLREEGGLLLMEGLLNISWGLRRPIRLQMYDHDQRFHYSRTTIQTPDPSSNRCEQLSQATLEFNNNIITDFTSTHLDDEAPLLPRTQSDASVVRVQRRSHTRSSSDLQRLRTHRYSINGHFYNHKTSVFTPAYGSVTNVRVSSSMTTPQVLSLLLSKFRVENKVEEFALYMVHESGERTRLKDCEFPLVCRVLHGPCEKIAKIFIMETDLGEEVTYDVAQYINFELPVLRSFVQKLKEEEEREISKVTERFSVLKAMIERQLEDGQTAGCM